MSYELVFAKSHESRNDSLNWNLSRVKSCGAIRADERCATSSQEDEVHALQKEHGVTVGYILNELCADKQHDTVIVALERFIHWRVVGRHRVTSRRIDEVMKVQSDW